MDAVHARTHAHRKQTQKLNQYLGLQLWTSIITLLLFYLNININSCDRMMVASLSLYTLLWTFSASSAVTIHCSRICSFFLPNIPIFATYLSLKLARCQVVFLLSLMILHWVVVIYRELRSCNKQRWRQHKKNVSSINNQQPMLPFTHFGGVRTQKEHSILFGTLSCVLLWEQEHVQGNLSLPRNTLRSVIALYIMRTTFGPSLP